MHAWSVVKVFVLVAIVSARGEEDAGEDDGYVQEVVRDALYFINACGSKDLAVCLKEKVLRYMDMLPDSFELAGIVKIKRLENHNSTGRPNDRSSLPEEARARENALDNMIMDRLLEFVGSHTIEIKMPKEAVGELKESFEEEGRKKKNKKGGGMSSLLMLFYLKMAALAAVALKILTLISFKALLLAKIALTISGVIGLKKLFDQKQTSTYEVIAHPHYEEFGQHDRSFGRDMAYRGQQDAWTHAGGRG